MAATETALAAAGVTAEVADERIGPLARVAAADVPAALGALKADGAVVLVDVFGVDTGEALEVTYHVRTTGGRDAYVRAEVAYDAGVASVWELFPAALYAERELAELFGVTLTGHPNPKRLLTTDEVDGYLLRKSLPIRTHGEVVRPGIERRPADDAAEGGDGDA